MIIPLWVLMIPAAIIVVLVIIFALINLLQVVRFGFFSGAALIAFLLFLTLASVVSMQTLISLGGIDWNAPLFAASVGNSSDIFGQ